MTLATRADLTSPLDQAAHDAVNAVAKATDQAVKAKQTAAHDALASARDMSQQLTNAAQSASDQAVTHAPYPRSTMIERVPLSLASIRHKSSMFSEC